MEAAVTTARARLRRRRLPVAREMLAPAGASVALAAIAAGCLLVVLASVHGRSFLAPTVHPAHPGWMTWPFGSLWVRHKPDRQTLQTGLLVALVGMTACYLVAIWLVPRVRLAVVGVLVALSYVILFFSPPLLLTDVFNYVEYARMGAVHGINPYAHIPAIGMRHDPVWKISNWHHLRSPYGPAFTLLTYALAPLGVAAAYWGYKALLLGVSLACAWLVVLIARRLGRSPGRAVVLVMLNPLVLVYGAGGQHMDPFNLVFLLAAIYLGLTYREQLGSAAAAASAAVKASAAALVPVAVAGTQRRLRSVLGFLIGAAMLGAMVLIAFGPHLPAIQAQSKLVTPYSIPNVVGWIVGQGGETAAVRTVCHAILAAAVVACTIWAWRTRDMIAPLGWLTLVTLVTLGWDMPWYLLWLLPFVAYVRGRAFRIASIVVALWLTLQWLPMSSRATHALGFSPGGHVWKLNKHYIHSLLH
jgi:alpha-1,6-mannosyltransferase